MVTALVHNIKDAIDGREPSHRATWNGNGPARQRPRLNPKWLEPYLDTRLCFDRLLQLRDRGTIPPEFQAAAHQFIHEYELLAQGKNPDVPR